MNVLDSRCSLSPSQQQFVIAQAGMGITCDGDRDDNDEKSCNF